MQSVDDHEKIKIASQFLLNAPPGEFNDVFNDIRVLISNDGLLQQGVAGTFQDYNTDQLTPVDMPGQKHKVIVSKYNQLDGSRYLDPRSGQSFTFDHMRLTASDPQPGPGGDDSQRKQLDDAFQAYVDEHYPQGVASVFGKGSDFTVCISSNKYNPRNYWNGRWRSVWTIKTSGNSATLNGVFKVQVHYFEDGNVQLKSEKTVELTASGANLADAIVKQAKKAEAEYQQALNESYAQLSDTTFKALRRALPITRNKLDWNKILTYKIGGELAQK